MRDSTIPGRVHIQKLVLNHGYIFEGARLEFPLFEVISQTWGAGGWQVAFSCLLLEPVCLGAESCLTLCNPMDCSPPGTPDHGASPGKKIGVGCHGLLQGIFLSRGGSQLAHAAGRVLPSAPPVLAPPLRKQGNTGADGLNTRFPFPKENQAFGKYTLLSGPLRFMFLSL